MDVLLAVNDRIKKDLVTIWKTMNKNEREHFINQVALALSVWGADDQGKEIAVEVFKLMMENEITTLADFGLFVDDLLELDHIRERRGKIERAAVILEGYRTKYGLSSEPHRDIL